MKRILLIVLALLLFASTFLPMNVSAAETTAPLSHFETPYEAQNENEVSVTAQNENARYGERYVQTVVDYDDDVVITRKADNQNPGGTCVDGGLYIDPDGGDPMNISIPVGWGSVYVAITPGSLSNNGSAVGVYVRFPDSNKYYHVYGEHHYLVERVRVDEYRGTELISTYYITRTTLIKTRWYTVEVT